MKHLDILKRNIKKFAVGATVFAALVVPALKCYMLRGYNPHI